ncbi:MAG: hypothetical protein JXQ73_29420 [Phycisphaerae bacterium]|nr:hypothetical protein [Phycisphaerae bacterium]
MARQPNKEIEQVVAEVGKYPIEAYQFIREGLGFTVDRIHGKETPIVHDIHKFMFEQDLDLADLDTRYRAGELPEDIATYLRDNGGAQAVNRHVGSRELCWGLRDFSLLKWGLLASVVLKSWNVTATADFGRIVFALVDNGYLQTEPQDRVEDFKDVYDFATAFDQVYMIGSQDEERETP